jgi:hypothetical protein
VLWHDVLNACLNQLYTAANRERFLVEELRELTGDLDVLTEASAKQLARSMARCVLELMETNRPSPGPLTDQALITLLTWYFPTEDQAFGAMGYLQTAGLAVVSKGLIIDNHGPMRYYLASARHQRDVYGTTYEQGQHLPCVLGPMRSDYLTMIATSRPALQEPD